MEISILVPKTVVLSILCLHIQNSANLKQDNFLEMLQLKWKKIFVSNPTAQSYFSFTMNRELIQN